MRGDVVKEVLRDMLFHWTYAKLRMRHGIRYTVALAGKPPRPHVPNERLRNGPAPDMF